MRWWEGAASLSPQRDGSGGAGGGCGVGGAASLSHSTSHRPLLNQPRVASCVKAAEKTRLLRETGLVGGT